jgi:hypothetical protein
LRCGDIGSSHPSAKGAEGWGTLDGGGADTTNCISFASRRMTTFQFGRFVHPLQANGRLEWATNNFHGCACGAASGKPQILRLRLRTTIVAFGDLIHPLCHPSD